MTIDLSPVLVTCVTGVFGLLGLWINYQIQTRMKEGAARDVATEGLKNALGAMQQAAEGVLKDKSLLITIPGIDPQLSVGVNYALKHLGPELKTLKIDDPVVLAGKLDARIGRAKQESVAIAIPSTEVPHVG